MTNDQKTRNAYYTPKALADAIVARVAKDCGAPILVVEPSAGSGVFALAAGACWVGRDRPVVWTVEPYPPAVFVPDLVCKWEDKRVDEEIAWTRGNVLIIGNPPYQLPEDKAVGILTAEKHVHLGLDRLRRWGGGWLVFLLRQSFAATKDRYDRLFSKGELRYRWTVVGRPSFTGGGTDSAEYEVFVWQTGYQGTPECGWLEWK